MLLCARPREIGHLFILMRNTDKAFIAAGAALLLIVGLSSRLATAVRARAATVQQQHTRWAR